MGIKALLIGINAYPGSPLAGCVNDVQDMQKLLSDHGVNDQEVLLDGDATAKNIRKAIEGAVRKVKNGDDLLYIHYSGHGSQVYDTSGDEKDRRDECLCPVDVDEDWDKNAITDDWLGAAVAPAARVGTVVLVLDSCFSGTMLRAAPSGAVPRYMEPPVAQRATQAVYELSTFVERLSHTGAILMSGCKEQQTSADAYFNDRPNGAFTYAMMRVLNARWKSKRRSPRYAIVTRRARAWLRRQGFEQRPQIEGKGRRRRWFR